MNHNQVAVLTYLLRQVKETVIQVTLGDNLTYYIGFVEKYPDKMVIQGIEITEMLAAENRIMTEMEIKNKYDKLMEGESMLITIWGSDPDVITYSET